MFEENIVTSNLAEKCPSVSKCKMKISATGSETSSISSTKLDSPSRKQFYYVCRLPLKKSTECWTHEKKPKHRILFRTSQDIYFQGISLLIHSLVDEILVNVCYKTDKDEITSLYSEKFTNVGKSSDSDSPVTCLVFRRPVQLRRD